MNRKILITTLLSLLSFSAVADNLTLGYCDGGFVGTSMTGSGQVAICLPLDEFGMYKGATVIGMRVGLASDAARGINVFVKGSLDAVNMVFQSSGTLYKGWNDIYFDTPIQYPDGDIWAGYEFGTSDHPGLSGFEGLKLTNSCWVQTANGWQDLSVQGQPPLCIQLIIDGDSYGVNDAALLKAEDVTAASGKPFSVTGFIRNNTSRVLSKARMSMECGTSIIEDDAMLEDILPGETGRFTFPVSGINQSGQFDAILRILNLDGLDDEVPGNNEVSCGIGLVGQFVQRKVLIEEFTGMRCINCPGGQKRIAEALDGLEDYVMVAHHIGFGPDALTVAGSDDLLWFYNKNGSSYAPAIMIDRINQGNTPGPVSDVGESEAMRSIIDDRMKEPAEVTVDILRNYDPETRLLTLNVKTQKVDGSEIGSYPVLTVCLIENGIIGKQEPAYEDYEHNKANRLFVTAPLGDSIDLLGDGPVSRTYSVPLGEGWNSANMEIVAFVSNYDVQNCNRCIVYNAAGCTLEGNDPISAIDDISVETVSVEGIYGISGLRQKSLRPGINIVRYTDGSIRKIMIR